MTNPSSPSAGGLTALGKAISAILVLGLIALGAYLVLRTKLPGANNNGNDTTQTAGGSSNNTADPVPAPVINFDTKELADTQTEVPKLDAPQAYVPKDDTIEIELSDYPGYAGLIVANNGLAPNDQSYFTHKYGMKVKITFSEEESTSRLNAGKLAASATTADVLPLYGRQFNVVVPAQISFSRGADGIVVTKNIKKINDLKGKTLALEQFTESDFFIRYLAHEAGMTINSLPDLKSKPDPDAINLVFCTDGLAAGDLFAKSLEANSSALAGCVTWAPATTTIPEQSNGKAKLLVTNINLLVIADILVVNKGFAEKNPDKVAALVDGLLMGNKMVTEDPDQYADLIAKSFSTPKDKWDHKRALAELTKVHLSNLPEQMAFFTGGVAQGGSFASIYESSFLAYGTDLISSHPSPDSFLSLDALKKAQDSGTYKNQIASLVPVKSRSGAGLENNPLLSRDLRFYFEPNSDKLDMTDQKNLQMLDNIKKMLDVSPGSSVALVGHVDDSKVAEFRQEGGDKLVQEMAVQAMDLSIRRSTEIKTRLIEREKIDAKQLDATGMGWTKPLSATNSDLNRRVEVQWFTLE